MKPAKLALLTILLGCTPAFAKAASDTGSPASQPGHEGTNQSTAANPSIGDNSQQYEDAYNKADAKTLAGFFSEDVDYTDPDGAEVKGRDAMEKLLADNFAQNPGVKLSIRTDEIKQVTPDVKVSRGVATVTLPNGSAQATRYTAVRVKKGDHWEITQLTETDAPAPNASSQLQTLDWLVGSWEDKSGDQVVQTKATWAGDKNFLVRTFKVKGADQSETDGWEIIGWDPIRQQIRSWIFDSNGGFGEASWVYDGDDWLIRASNILPDGSRSTAENLLTKVDDNNFTWESQNRTLNGEPQPALDTIEVRRVSGSQ
jgi:uncharacterized protein (TIGR02246 family)